MKTYRDLDLKAIRDACGLDFAYHTYNKGHCSCCYGPLDMGRGWAKGKKPKKIAVSEHAFKWDKDTDNIAWILFKNAYNCGGRIKSLDEPIEDSTCISYHFTSEIQKIKVCNMLQQQLGSEYTVSIPEAECMCIVIRLTKNYDTSASIYVYENADRQVVSPEFSAQCKARAWYKAHKQIFDTPIYFAEKYRGYTIEKPKPDSYMKANGIKYLAYDRDGMLFDGDSTAKGIRQKIDSATR